jgi:diaminopimelate decarboxylase
MFVYKGTELYCENVKLADIAQKYGTPLYVYSADTIRKRVNNIKDALSDLPDVTISFAAKVNNNLSILRLLADMGLGADIISAGELYRFLQAGGDPAKVMFAGVAKSREEISYALDKGIFMFNAESLPELSRIDEIARAKGITANVSVRINPDVEAGTHDKITTGKRGSKFGIAVSTLLANTDSIKKLKNIKIIGVDVHIGSQILDVKPYADAYKVLASVVAELRAAGFDISVADIGGGIGIPYQKGKSFDFEAYKREVVPVLKSIDAKIVIEPGRYIVGESGALLMNVEYIKHEWDKDFVVVNAGMNEYIRVAMYDAYNDILPLVKRPGEMTADVVGPVCETSDIFAKDRVLSPVEADDLVALMDAGAYGMSMASNYNARPLIAEVLVDGGKMKLIRRRQTLEDMMMYEN